MQGQNRPHGALRLIVMPDEKHPTPTERDEPIKIDLDPETTLKGLLKVDPEPREKDEEPPQGDPLAGQ